jgi:hypothetical protein
VDNPHYEFYRLIIKHGLTKEEIDSFYFKCSQWSKKMEQQKAEGYIHFHPLFEEFLLFLPSKLDAKKGIQACDSQKLFEPLFQELAKFLN